jgi:hypothetical protein
VKPAQFVAKSGESFVYGVRSMPAHQAQFSDFGQHFLFD